MQSPLAKLHLAEHRLATLLHALRVKQQFRAQLPLKYSFVFAKVHAVLHWGGHSLQVILHFPGKSCLSCLASHSAVVHFSCYHALQA